MAPVARELNALKTSLPQHLDAALAHERMAEVSERVGEAMSMVEEGLRLAAVGPAPVEEAALHLLRAGGKRVRPILCLLTTSIFDGSTTRAVPCAIAAELVHTATLLHDDVIDEGDVRRGKAATRVVWGNLVSVLAGDLLLTEALKLVQRLNEPALSASLLETLSALVHGEVRQLNARGNTSLGLEGYMEIVRGKTASLFRFACEGGARLAQATDEQIETLGNFGEAVGIAFQIIDDVIDLQGNPERTGKRLGVDLEEGKTTLPLALALQHEPARLGDLLAKAHQSADPDVLHALVVDPALKRGCEEARRYAEKLTAEALESLRLLPTHPVRELLIQMVRTLALRDC